MSDALYETYKKDKNIEAIKFIFLENVLNDYYNLNDQISLEDVSERVIGSLNNS